ncbi:MAG: HD domain-containing protein [Gemmatimonadetes bacterium]|nr:HD domain-containing protein [Gemmatimonadota bacterium]
MSNVLHPAPSAVVQAAARGELPAWTVASPGRREHMARVAALLSEWAEALDLSLADRARWVAVGWLHDALRDAPPEELRERVPLDFRHLPGPTLHGPAAAERLEGSADPEMLQAIRYHTIGHSSFGELGKALYLADFLEPGRDFDVDWRASLTERMPDDLNSVLLEVLGARLQHLVEVRKPIRPETAAFWSAAVKHG